MVRKITSFEYLKRYDNMSILERQMYLERVDEWLSHYGPLLTGKVDVFEAKVQNVQQFSAAWNDTECGAFEEGAVLMSALITISDTRLPDLLYAISAKRSIKRMYEVLWEVEAQDGPVGGAEKGEVDKNDERNAGSVANGAGVVNAEKRKRGRPRKVEAEATQSPGNEKRVADGMAVPVQGASAVPVRPKHIDQYVHLLPRKTQERAGMVKDLLQQMDVARENVRLLMSDQKASGDDRAKWASLATKCDKEVRSIYKELDEEWEKLIKTGMVVVDDFGNARVIAANGENTDGVQGKDGAEGTAVQSPGKEQSGAPKDTSKRRSLRKWLTDVRSGNSSEEAKKEHAKKWLEKFEEYLKIEGDISYEDVKIKKAAEHYGVELKVKD